MRELLTRVAADLRSLNARHAVVDGHAVSARTEPRFTRDLDFAVAVADDRQAQQLAGALAARGYRIVAAIEQESTGRLAT
jgi:predicted DNA-binding ribbon-helix-helix protein